MDQCSNRMIATHLAGSPHTFFSESDRSKNPSATELAHAFRLVCTKPHTVMNFHTIRQPRPEASKIIGNVIITHKATVAKQQTTEIYTVMLSMGAHGLGGVRILYTT